MRDGQGPGDPAGSRKLDAMSAAGSKAGAVVLYTALRVGLFLAVWLTFELLTPVSGLWAIVARSLFVSVCAM